MNTQELKSYFNRILTIEEAYRLFEFLVSEDCNDFLKAAILGNFINRPLTLNELFGFRNFLASKMIPLDFDFPILDIVGTGGDHKNSFNISTLACFVVAGCGFKVVKHGNYSASSFFGSSNILESLGYKFSVDKIKLNAQLKAANICFLHAPLFHPSLKPLGPIRKQIGMRTFINLLGPLLNPANPKFQMIGVSSFEIARLYHYYLEQTPCNYKIIHCLNGYDEISLTGETKIISRKGEFVFLPNYFTKQSVCPDDLLIETEAGQATIQFESILKGQGPAAQIEVVLVNAAEAVNLLQPDLDYHQSYLLVQESIKSGKAFQSLINMLNNS
ncbi:MAG: anthranilate phosphoribosyltransferase [Sediminibacterium sp.]|nr:anthranilate phosphoribosyltransferase [Sediminibacterium sp.]